MASFVHTLVPYLHPHPKMNNTYDAQTVHKTTAWSALNWLDTVRVFLEHSMTFTSFSLTVILLILTLILCITRIYSGLHLTSSDTGRHRVKTVRMLPYWIPFLGHILTLSKDPDKLIRNMRYVSTACSEKHAVADSKFLGINHDKVCFP